MISFYMESVHKKWKKFVLAKEYLLHNVGSTEKLNKRSSNTELRLVSFSAEQMLGQDSEFAEFWLLTKGIALALAFACLKGIFL